MRRSGFITRIDASGAGMLQGSGRPTLTPTLSLEGRGSYEASSGIERGILSLVLCAATVGLLSCGIACQVNMPGSEPPPNGDGTVTFSGDVQPLLSAVCAGCHSPGGAAMLAGIPMDLRSATAYDDVVNQPSVQDPTWTLVVPGDAESSLLFLKVSMDDPPIGDRMPRFAPPLSAAQIEAIRDWIDQGALDD